MVDVSVIQAFESGALQLSDFYFTGDDYRYRFVAQAKQGFIDLIRERFNAGATYKGRTLKWDTVIEQNASKLGKYLVEKASDLDFSQPTPTLERIDTHQARELILSLSLSQAEELGLGRSTLHQLQANAKSYSSFRMYGKVCQKLKNHVA